MTLRNVPKSFTLEEQRQEVNEIAVDLDTAVDGVQTFGGDKTFTADVTFSGTVSIDTAGTIFNEQSDLVVSAVEDLELRAQNSGKNVYIAANDDVIMSSSFGSVLTKSQLGSKLIDSDAVAGDVSLSFVTTSGPNGSQERLVTTNAGVSVLGDLEVGNEIHSSDGALYLKTADQITPGQMVTEAIFGGSMYVPYGFSTYPITEFPSGNIDETSTNAGFSVSSGGQIYIANISAQALWKGRQVGTAGLTSEIDAAGNAEFAGTVTGGAFAGPLTGNVTGNLTGDVTGDLTGNVTGNASGTAGSTGVLSAGATGADLTLSGNLTSAGTVTSTTANNTYAFEVKNGSTNIGGLYRSGTSDTRLILKNVSGTTIVLKGSDGSITADSITTTGSVSFGNTLDLPNANTYITGAGHNVLQVDATRTYFYGGTNGVQLRKADNSSEIVTIDDDGNATFDGDIDTAGTLTFTGQTNSATGTASSDALDHYEEGTWTPTPYYQNAGDQSAASFTTANGYYTRIGNIVHVSGYVVCSGPSSPANDNVGINSFPYNNALNVPAVGTVMFENNGIADVHIRIEAGASLVTLLTTSGGGNLGDELGTSWSASFQITYRVA